MTTRSYVPWFDTTGCVPPLIQCHECMCIYRALTRCLSSYPLSWLHMCFFISFIWQWLCISHVSTRLCAHVLSYPLSRMCVHGFIFIYCDCVCMSTVFRHNSMWLHLSWIRPQAHISRTTTWLCTCPFIIYHNCTSAYLPQVDMTVYMSSYPLSWLCACDFISLWYDCVCTTLILRHNYVCVLLAFFSRHECMWLTFTLW